jgi:hypothetical protein
MTKNPPQTAQNILLKALAQSAKIIEYAKYCETIALFEQDKESAKIFSNIQSEASLHAQGHLDFLIQVPNQLPTSSTHHNKRLMNQILEEYSDLCRTEWVEALLLDSEKSDIVDWLENTAKSHANEGQKLLQSEIKSD